MFQSTHLHEVWHCRFALLLPKMPVSIHTPTWGVTCMSSIVCKFRSFQSTHLHEVWLCDRRSIRLYGAVSIHTPTWGVTTSVYRRYDTVHCFNPHTYMRCDFIIWCLLRLLLVSIHTPTWGVTVNTLIDITSDVVSIHTPTWGVT